MYFLTVPKELRKLKSLTLAVTRQFGSIFFISGV